MTGRWQPSINKHSVLGLVAGVASSLVAVQLLGQNASSYSQNVPLTYTMVAWQVASMEAISGDRDETLYQGGRRSDGSSVLARYELGGDGTPSVVREIADLGRGQHMLVDSSLKSVTTGYLAEQVVEHRRKGGICPGETAGTMLGYEVIRDATTSHEAQGGTRSEVLRAPDLGCLALENQWFMTDSNGAEQLVRVERVVDIQLGEPDPALFEVPADYVEMSPAQRFSAQHPDADMSLDGFMPMIQRNYEQNRAR